MVHKHAKQTASHRIKILQGQLRGIERMLNENAYCVDILTQSIAIQRSLRSLDVVLLKQHLETCVREGMKSGKGQKYINELLQLYKDTIS
ncbi:metal-sensitive transcriptional regulator [Candidatus Uhrbacteria bacterium]|nr:metal-sensitive transcriptional regulator [Candidatus Uhrbacteria bacterium]